MDWKRLHHLYLGIIGAFACLGWTAIQLGRHDLRQIEYSVIGAILFLLWSLDDTLYHRRGWKTPCWWLEQGLRKIKIYKRFSDWLNKLFKEEKMSEWKKLTTNKATNAPHSAKWVLIISGLIATACILGVAFGDLPAETLVSVVAPIISVITMALRA